MLAVTAIFFRRIIWKNPDSLQHFVSVPLLRSLFEDPPPEAKCRIHRLHSAHQYRFHQTKKQERSPKASASGRLLCGRRCHLSI